MHDIYVARKHLPTESAPCGHWAAAAVRAAQKATKNIEVCMGGGFQRLTSDPIPATVNKQVCLLELNTVSVDRS